MSYLAIPGTLKTFPIPWSFGVFQLTLYSTFLHILSHLLTIHVYGAYLNSVKGQSTYISYLYYSIPKIFPIICMDLYILRPLSSFQINVHPMMKAEVKSGRKHLKSTYVAKSWLGRMKELLYLWGKQTCQKNKTQSNCF